MASSSFKPTAPIPIKILVAGGFGVGKTTFVGAVSEIPPLSTEEQMTVASLGTDDVARTASKTTTTVALDFGRISIGHDIVLYLFGTPGQKRFARLWPELAWGALGAVVLLDTRRLEDGFAAIDFFERRRTPFVLAVNCFSDGFRYEPEEVRAAAAVPENTPVLLMDARKRESCKTALITLVQHARTMRGATTPA